MNDQPASPAHASPSVTALRIEAIEALLVERRLITSDVVDAIIDTYEHHVGPMNGARVVARAWVDPDYRARLLEDATSAVGELGFGGAEGEHLVVLENTDAVHNVVVCTLCSCYPWPVLGLPPRWYKSSAYRSRMVREPRAVLAEFGTTLPDDVELRVWDSSAEVRYLVLPLAPGDAADRPEDELVASVTRDHMIGVVR
ncbi:MULTISPECIES: nitrile hydratase subunit alpha [unclassified Nocardioides]|uniref:nitrile hydratase subunit alpha n=1 Tax=unclassified Nocardioides TaxID=2615069 RepID=UPI0006F4BDAC|nr:MULTISPECIES: nitrile hydratase subunit alpha [unclassified Nocardioides]KRA32798.1 nitrile hydratase subunit alpha [Nocardioides sp. Root614]KRA89450.1 nitrile hydratase subunit alpha [Nocardioides sp. Root682]